MDCQVSHYVRHIDEEQTVAQYDYHWCNTHACMCDPDGCKPANTTSTRQGVGVALSSNDLVTI
jgi:hypothetical protein